MIADTVIALIHLGYMKAGSPAAMTTLATRLGIDYEAFRQAAVRFSRDGIRVPAGRVVVPSPSLTVVPNPEPAVAPVPVPKPPSGPERTPRRPKSQLSGQPMRPEMTVDGERWLCCTSGKCGPGRDGWNPETEFLARVDRPGHRVSKCHECRRRYQAERHVKVATREALEAVGVQFTLDEHSNLIGLACAKCGVPFEPGDVAHGETRLSHDFCPDR